MEAIGPREVTIRYLVQFDNQWNLLRIVHENDIAPEDLDIPEGVWMLDGGNFGQDDFMGIGIAVDIDAVSEYGYDSSQIFFSHDYVLEKAKEVFDRWVRSFQAMGDEAFAWAFKLDEQAENSFKKMREDDFQEVK